METLVFKKSGYYNVLTRQAFSVGSMIRACNMMKRILPAMGVAIASAGTKLSKFAESRGWRLMCAIEQISALWEPTHKWIKMTAQFFQAEPCM